MSDAINRLKATISEMEDSIKRLENEKKDILTALLEKEGWQTVDDALGAVRTSQRYYASTNKDMIDVAVKTLHSRSKNREQTSPFLSQLMFHLAIALAASSGSGSSAAEFYDWIGKNYFDVKERGNLVSREIRNHQS
jgi:prophage antirepressor-like protein